MAEEEKQGQKEAASAPTAKQIKHDWYQSERFVIVTLLCKNIQKLGVQYNPETIKVDVHLPNGESISKTFDLEHNIVPDNCTYKIMPSKAEIRLAKAEGYHWTSLEKKVDAAAPKKETRNWDKIASDFQEDPPEGDAALNALFQKIYEEGTDEVKKAMNKSFMESGGTELNTNWNAVAKDKVSVKPPDGMEWKRWDK